MKNTKNQNQYKHSSHNENKNQNKSCCDSNSNNEKSGKSNIKQGIVYGLVPHAGCIAFIIFSVLGVTTATTLFKPLLLNPYFFYILVALSFVFATISAIVYLNKQGVIVFQKTEVGNSLNVSPEGIKTKWKYLSTLYGTTIFVNLLLFLVVFPMTANFSAASSITGAVAGVQSLGQQSQSSFSTIKLQVNIPCSGHASLITDELKKVDGVTSVKFSFPNIFDVTYDSTKTSKQQILSLEVFNSYKATVTAESQQTNVQSGNGVVADNVVVGAASASSGSNGGSCCGGGGCGDGSSEGSGGCGCGRQK